MMACWMPWHWLIPFLLFQFFPNSLVLSYSPIVPPNSRVDCSPKPGEGRADCLARGCQWDEQFDKYHPSVPLCYFPPGTGYGILQRVGPNELVLKRLSSGAKNPYGQDFEQLHFSVHPMGPSAVHIRIGTEGRFVPPVPLHLDAKIVSEGEKLLVEVFPNKSRSISPNEFFYFTVRREAESGGNIWDTSIGGLLFADQFIQIATFLPSDRLYGFGENSHQQLKHDFSKYSTWGMYSRDEGPEALAPNSANSYGVHPFYVGLEPSGKAHGVLIFNSNPQEISTGPGPHLIYRTIGGQLDIFFFPGPRPEQVIQQYQQLIGRPTLPAFWALGYQFSRYGYKDLDELKATIGRIQAAQIPLDVVFADINYMDGNKDFSVDPGGWSGLGDYVRQLHTQGLKFVPIVDPAVEVAYAPFARARRANASFVEWENFGQVPREVQSMYALVNDTKIMLGIVWPEKHAAFPDFLDPENRTQKWWADELKLFHEQVPFDGIWIDMNEPSNFDTNQPKMTKGLQTLKCPLNGPDSHFDVPPYQTINAFQWGNHWLSEKSLCLLGRTGRGKFNLYGTHNLYGWSETVATKQALEFCTGQRGEVISRSTFPSSGHFGSHWTGDNRSRWPDLRASIIGVIEANMFGIPHVGADVCGFSSTATEELCLRWQQLGAWHSFFRNHNCEKPQDPPQWPSVAKASRAANLFRYAHLAFLYSLHFRASLLGGTVIRPLFFEFPHDFNAHQISFQFLWGESLMVVPVLYAGVDTVRAYFPSGAIWYSISDAHKYGKRMAGGYQTVNAPRDTALPAFLRGGTIIVKQKPEMTTGRTRQNDFQLAIALDPTSLTAQGELYWDDGQSIVVGEDFATYSYFHFKFSFEMASNGTAGQLSIKCTHWPMPGKLFPVPALSSVEVFGYPSSSPSSSMKKQYRLSLNGLAFNNWDFQLNARKEYLQFDLPEKFRLDENLGQDNRILWMK